MNRFLGTLFALATIVAAAFAILNYGNYTSMCFSAASADSTTVVDIPAEESAPTVDVVDDTASDATIAPLADTTVVDAVATPDRSPVEPISM